MKSYFPADFFSGNRRRLRELFTGTAPIVITGSALLQRNSDMAQPFRQDSSFWYLTGINEPEIVLVIDKDKEYLIVPERTEVRNIFDGAIDNEKLSRRSGISEILDAKEGWQRLGTRLKRAKKVATLTAAVPYIDVYEFYVNPARAALIEKLQGYSTGLELVDIKEGLGKLRVVKQPEELKAIGSSIDLTVAALKQLPALLSKFSHEYEIEAYLFQAYRQKGARLGYTPMVASGKNACVLHYDANDDPLSSGQLLLVDSGAEVEFYSADITRTFPIGKPTKRQQEVHQAVQEVFKYALQGINPGVSIKENEKRVEQFMGQKLRQLGLIKTLTREDIRRYFPHATSHYLGLDLHDAGDYEAPLMPGMVLTVEPGIYIPEEGIGVRVEDNILITESGHRNLSASLPISLS